MRYKVVVSKNIMEFQKLCSDLIEAGYDPVGTFTTSNKEYLQAFVNYIHQESVKVEPKPEPKAEAIVVPKTEEEFLKGFNKAMEAEKVNLNEEAPKRIGRPPKSTLSS